MKTDYEWMGKIPPGTYHRESLTKHMPRREGGYLECNRLGYALRHYGARHGVRAIKGTPYVEVRGKGSMPPWGELLSVEWVRASTLLAIARERGFQLPEEDHAARIEVGRGVRRVPGVRLRHRSGYTLYAGPYGDRD